MQLIGYVILICTLLLLTVVLDAMEDAFHKRKWPILAHWSGAFMVFFFIVLAGVYRPNIHGLMNGPIIFEELGPIIGLLFGYIGFRFALFNIAWNISRGVPINYVGTTSFVDQFEQILMPAATFYITRVFAFLWGIAVTYVTCDIYVF